MAEYKGLLHIDESKKWNLLLTNVENTLKSGEEVELVVVANAEAVRDLAQEGDLRDRIQRQNDQGVTFAACRNALISNNIDIHSLPEFVEIVPAGIVELIKRQMGGFCYIKP
ncbi:MAG: hypothetical protein ACOX2Q_07660 [Dehalobacterium sp.]